MLKMFSRFIIGKWLDTFAELHSFGGKFIVGDCDQF